MKTWKRRLAAGAYDAGPLRGLAPGAFAASAYDCPGQKLAALTFDDGPGPYSDAIFRHPEGPRGQGHLFMNGYKVRNYAPQVRRMVAEGHQIGNHTYNHPYLAKSPPPPSSGRSPPLPRPSPRSPGCRGPGTPAFTSGPLRQLEQPGDRPGRGACDLVHGGLGGLEIPERQPPGELHRLRAQGWGHRHHARDP